MTSPITSKMTRPMTYGLTAPLGTIMGQGGAVPIVPTDFPFVFDGNTPVFDAQYKNESGTPINYFLFNGVTYTSLAAFIAAGGADVGGSPISTAGWWSPPHTILITGVAPSAYNASTVNTCLAVNNGSFTTNYVDLRFLSTAPGSQLLVRSGNVTGADLRVTSDALGGTYGAAFTIATNDVRYSSRARQAVSDTSVVLPVGITQMLIGTSGVAGQEWGGSIYRVTIW